MKRTLLLSKNIANILYMLWVEKKKKKSIGWYKVCTAEQGIGKIRTQGVNVPKSV